ncbi:tetratricopeptide repeat protein [Cellulophaga baltica]|uniref:tetratricopeptide repeat protein n=1 Tax=Cellulophaga TaxID=104264 RepID=UPI001C07CD8C|nr:MULTISPECIES: tetratricopeptide repeat protein [Cellulophaga]MBU2995742.1 tetratricopeptide repeat protein [Cellulophaga baltica]MDO6767136.1 tetratricopeptide repeat protein [Cellulophaga sp. 1_MG-2023]
MKKILFIFILFIGCFGFSQNEALFKKANKAYNTGDYDVAAKNYLKIIENGEHSAELYFNLGNVYYKQNQIAPSIYYFEKALLLKPNDKDIKNNLAYAQNMALDAIEVLPKTGLSRIYRSLTSYFTFDQWAYTSIGLMFLFIIGYLLYYFLNYATQKRIAFVGSIICLLLSIATILIAYIEYNTFKSDQPAIVFDKEVIIKSEPNNSSQETFRLHQGTKVNVIENLNDWQKIKIADGKTGWLTSESIKLLKDI